MKKNFFPCLLLSGAMLLSLTACGGDDTQTTPTPDAEVTATPEIEATATPDITVPDESETPDDTLPDESETPAVETTPEATPEVSEKPAATPAPSEKPAETPAPTEKPAETPTPSAPAVENNATAAEVYTAVFAAANGAADFEVTDMIDTFYSVSLDDLADAVYYMPMTSANVEEIFIARVQSGKLSAVKSACEERLEQLKADAELYVATGAYVANAQIVTEGDWIMLCVCPDADAAVSAFRDSVK